MSMAITADFPTSAHTRRPLSGSGTIGWHLPTDPAQWHRRTSVVVLGSGAAGLMAVVGLVMAGVDTLLVTRGEVTDSSTDWAQGGLAAVWSPTDDTDLHVSDTLTAGAGLCNETAVRDLAEHAPEALRRLIELGAVFDKDASGAIDLHLEGGHHARRILHAGGDQSGHEVERALVTRLDAGYDPGRHLQVLDGTRAIDILRDGHGRACGLRAFDARGQVGEIRASAVVLATGGIGQLWPVSTNPPVSTGDGLAMAMRAGARVRDVEFMQFHPTILVVPKPFRRPGDRGVLISEAVRGEGAILIDHAGQRVMTGVHPLVDLAPRDVVSAAEHAHMMRTGEENLFLDATSFGPDRWEHSFPSILQMCRARGVDPVTEPIPVSPGAHYHCGGVVADMAGHTGIEGLYAVGEVACTGIQGANRLASNSLTEGLVMGWRCAQTLAAALPVMNEPGEPVVPRDTGLVAASGFATVRTTMAHHVGVLRDADGLRRAHHLLGSMPVTDVLDDGTLTATNAVQVARAIAIAAATRTESRGCHRRSDITARDDSWLRHLDWRIGADGMPQQAPSHSIQPSHQEAA